MRKLLVGLAITSFTLIAGCGSQSASDESAPPNRGGRESSPGFGSPFARLQGGPEASVPQGDRPSANTGDRLKQAEKELADLDQSIAGKEKELADLRRKADALRQEIVTLKQGAEGGLVASPQQLVAGLPDNARPKDHNDTIRINRANDWLKENLPGKRIQWDYRIGDVRLERMSGSKNYTVTLYAGSNNQEKWNTYTLHGLEYYVSVPNNNFTFSDVDEATTERLDGLKNKSVKLTATLTGASLGGNFNVGTTDIIINGIKSGLPRALDDVKSTDPAVRQAALKEIASASPNSKWALPAVLELLKDKDEAVRESAIYAITAIDPQNKAIADLVPKKASVDGKYAKLLFRMHVPDDKGTYGDFSDSGYYNAYPEYKNYKNIPAGYWVYVYPNWYIWGEQKK